MLAIADEQFWDPRKEEAVRSYTHHFDYISDFAYFDDKHHLVTTSFVLLRALYLLHPAN
jgi:hypothetical protein